MKARLKWVEGVQFVGHADSGHPIVLDGPPEGGGRNLGLRPMELILLGTGGCTAYDVVHILKRARQPIVDCEVELQAQRAETPPKVFTHIHIRFIVTGREGLNARQVERAVRLSAEKYCSASLMLGKVVEISHDYEVRIVPD